MNIQQIRNATLVVEYAEKIPIKSNVGVDRDLPSFPKFSKTRSKKSFSQLTNIC